MKVSLMDISNEIERLLRENPGDAETISNDCIIALSGKAIAKKVPLQQKPPKQSRGC